MGKLSQLDCLVSIKLSLSEIKYHLKKRYVSKTSVGRQIQSIEQALDELEIKSNPDNFIKDTDDQEVKYVMIVNDVDGLPSQAWREELKQRHGVPAELEEKYMKEMAVEIIEAWNEGIPSHHPERKRKLVKFIKEIIHTREL